LIRLKWWWTPTENAALHFMHYNFCRIYQTLRVTPAMEAGVSDHVWTIDEVVAMMDIREGREAA